MSHIASLMPLALAFTMLSCPLPTLGAWNHFDPSDTSQVPRKFSEIGFYADWNAKTVTPEAISFDVNTPLWSDNAHKARWVLLKPGSPKIQFDPENDYYDYPDGAIFVKLFQHDTIPGDPSSRIYWETRLLVNQKVEDPNSSEMVDYWHPFSYRWNPDGSEAFLVSKNGFDTSLTVWINGNKSFRKWSYPSPYACNQCHRQYDLYNTAFQGRTVLGFFTPQINRPAASTPSVNQITQLFQAGILGWSKPVPTPVEIASWPKWADVADETATLDLRARAYIASNCSGCHGTRGLMVNAPEYAAAFNYDFFKIRNGVLSPEMDLRNMAVGVFGVPSKTIDGEVVHPALIVPGHPDLSVLLYRMKQRNRIAPTEGDAYSINPEQMPPVGVYEVDTVANDVISRWIASLPPVASIGKREANRLQPGLIVRDRVIYLAGTTQKELTLIGTDGRQYITKPMGSGFRIPEGLAPGIYLLRVKGSTLRLVL